MTMPTKWCCESMKDKSTILCDIHDNEHDCPDVLIVWSTHHGPGISIKDGGSSFIVINFCPWCGQDLHDPHPNIKTHDI